MNTLSVRNLSSTVYDSTEEKYTEILKSVDLDIGPGETHILMGSNGSGKSTSPTCSPVIIFTRQQPARPSSRERISSVCRRTSRYVGGRAGKGRTLSRLSVSHRHTRPSRRHFSQKGGRGVPRARDSRRRVSKGAAPLYEGVLEYITPDAVHLMKGGRIVRSGGTELSTAVHEHGLEAVGQ